MRMFHCTIRLHKHSIEEHGVCTRYSQGKMPVVWVCTEQRLEWAFLHTVRRHGGKIEDVIAFEVEVDEFALKRSAADGLYYLPEDIRPEYIRGYRSFLMVSESPLERGKSGKK